MRVVTFGSFTPLKGDRLTQSSGKSTTTIDAAMITVAHEILSPVGLAPFDPRIPPVTSPGEALFRQRLAASRQLFLTAQAARPSQIGSVKNSKGSLS
jgi:hypothetical protein